MTIRLKVTRWMAFACICACVIVISGHQVHAATTTRVDTSNDLHIKHVAPGGALPMTVKLMNFGSDKRVDVTVYYDIRDEYGQEVLSLTETVAVETTASFIKQIQLPATVSPGRYVATSRIIYQNQEFPATSSFEFTVERQIFGIFISQFFLYAGITIVISLSLVLLSHILIKRRSHRFVAHKYDGKPKSEQIYFEMISDIISEMRVHKGDDALEVAANIPGLKIDKSDGKVIDIKGSPAEIITLLVIGFEKKFKTKLSMKKQASKKDFDKNIKMFKKYFE